MRMHPLAAVDWELLEFWLKQVQDYKRSPNYHDIIHKELIAPRYSADGPLPVLTLLAGGIQAGKSTLGAAHMFAMHWRSKILWIVGERYDDTRLEFKYLTDTAVRCKVMDPKDVSSPAAGPCKAVFSNGAVVRTLSSEDETTLAGESPDGVLMVEAGRQSYQAFRTLWTRVAQNTGWLLVSGTFEQYKGRWFPDLWKMCQGGNEFYGRSFSLPTYANPEKYPDGAKDAKILAIRKTLTDDEFAERFEGTPRSPLGVVFPEFRRSLHVNHHASYNPLYPVRLWVDPGYYPSSYAVLFTQIVNGQIRILKEYYTNSQLPDYMTVSPMSKLPSLTHSQIVEMVVQDEWIEGLEKVVIDIAAQAHAGAGESGLESWQRGFAGRSIPIMGRYVKIEEGLKRTHDKLQMNYMTGEPHLIINPSCENTIWEFEDGYRYNVNTRGEMGQMGKPVDKNNHSMKAVAYGIIDEYGLAEGQRPMAIAPTRKSMRFERIGR